MKKIQLIMPEHEYKEICSEGWSLPLGILSIATYLKMKNPKLEVGVISGGITPHKEMLRRVNADIVGISTTLGNYRNGLEIARKAKERNPKTKVIFGGPHATVLYEPILRNRGLDSHDPCIDGIVLGDGVEAFYDYITCDDLKNITNFAYMEHNEIKKNPTKRDDLNSIPMIDRSFLDIDSAFKKYVEKFGSVTPFRRAANIMSQYGCTSKWCRFCGRIDREWRGRDPKRVWEEIRYLIEENGIDYFFDFSDSFVSNIKYVRSFLKAKPTNLNPAFRFFARSDQINEEIAKLIKEIGCYEVYVGMESGDQGCLNSMNKGTTIKQNLEAAKLANKYEMRLLTAYVLGAPGETEKSLENTLEHVRWISKIADVEGILCSIWIPMPGSWSFRQLLQNSQVGYKYRDQDLLDLIELKKDWVNQYCNISYEGIEYFIPKILGYAPIKDTKGVEKETP